MLRPQKLARFGLAGSLALIFTFTPQTIHTVNAATDTTNMNVQLVIQASCSFEAANDLDFGTATTPLTGNLDASATIGVVCTDGTPYDIGLDAGTTAGASVAVRKMYSAVTAQDVDYKLYQDASRAAVWGNTVGTDTVGGTGKGSATTHTVYGRVPAQATPAPGTYTDVIRVTVTY